MPYVNIGDKSAHLWNRNIIASKLCKSEDDAVKSMSWFQTISDCFGTTYEQDIRKFYQQQQQTKVEMTSANFISTTSKLSKELKMCSRIKDNSWFNLSSIKFTVEDKQKNEKITSRITIHLSKFSKISIQLADQFQPVNQNKQLNFMKFNDNNEYYLFSEAIVHYIKSLNRATENISSIRSEDKSEIPNTKGNTHPNVETYKENHDSSERLTTITETPTTSETSTTITETSTKIPEPSNSPSDTSKSRPTSYDGNNGSSIEMSTASSSTKNSGSFSNIQTLQQQLITSSTLNPAAVPSNITEEIKSQEQVNPEEPNSFWKQIAATNEEMMKNISTILKSK